MYLFKVSDPMQIAFKVKSTIKLVNFYLTKYNDNKSTVIPDTTFMVTGLNGFDKTLTMMKMIKFI